MRKLLGVLAASSLCLVLGLNTGCSPAKEKAKGSGGGKDGLTAEPASAELKEKGAKAEVKFNKDIASVTPATEHGVSHSTEGMKVTFTVADLPTEAKEAKFKVKSKDDKEMDYVVKVAAGTKKPGGTATVTPTASVVEKPLEPVDLDPKENTLVLNLSPKGDDEVGLSLNSKKAMIEKAEVKGEKVPGVEVKVNGPTVSVVARGAKPGKFDIEVTAKGGKAGAIIHVEMKQKEAAPPPPPPTPPAEDLAYDAKTPLKFTAKKDMDVTETIKFTKGMVDSVAVEPPGKAVTATLGKDNTVKITIAKDAAAADYTIKVKAKDGKKGVDIPIKVAAPISAEVEEARLILTPRQVAISAERFISVNRRM